MVCHLSGGRFGRFAEIGGDACVGDHDVESGNAFRCYEIRDCGRSAVFIYIVDVTKNDVAVFSSCEIEQLLGGCAVGIATRGYDCCITAREEGLDKDSSDTYSLSVGLL